MNNNIISKRFVALLFVLASAIPVLGAEVARIHEHPSHAINTPYEYPVTQRSFAWTALESHADMLRAVQVPSERLQAMTTEAVAETALRYPLFPDVNAFDRPQDGFEHVAADSNVLRELIERRDSGRVLLAMYQRQAITADAAMRVDALELLLAQPEVLGQLDAAGRDALAARANSVASAKRADHETFGDSGIERTALLLGRTLDLSHALPFVFDPQLDASLKEFLRDGTTHDPAVVGILFARGHISSDALKAAPADYYTYVRTPRGSYVLGIVYTTELTSAQITQLNNYVQVTYPKAVRESNASRRYNCHSYAWYWASTSNTVWINDPSAYWRDGSYLTLGTYNGGITLPTTVPDGARATYPNIAHSAIKISSTQFRSKWGQYPVMRHAPNYSPYACMNCSFPLVLYRLR